MSSRKQESATPRSGESKVREEGRRHNDRTGLGILIDCFIFVYIHTRWRIMVTAISVAGNGPTVGREKRDTLVHKIKTICYTTQTS